MQPRYHRTTQDNLWILAYDIRCPQRLRRVHRTVRQWGIPLQYSIFLIEAKRAELQALIDELEHDIIDPRVDDVRIYPVCANTEVWCLGRQQPVTLEMFLSEAGEETADLSA